MLEKGIKTFNYLLEFVFDGDAAIRINGAHLIKYYDSSETTDLLQSTKAVSRKIWRIKGDEWGHSDHFTVCEKDDSRLVALSSADNKDDYIFPFGVPLTKPSSCPALLTKGAESVELDFSITSSSGGYIVIFYRGLDRENDVCIAKVQVRHLSPDRTARIQCRLSVVRRMKSYRYMIRIASPENSTVTVGNSKIIKYYGG
jgi:hypothetical protein